MSESSFTNSETAEIKQFAEQGYLIIDPQIEDIDEIAVDLRDNVPYPIHNGRPHNRVQDYWSQNASVRSLACLPKVLETLELLYQRRPIPFQTLNFPVGTEQRTHSDTIHFNSIPERWMCGVWVALEDIDEDNGPLHYYPGSQKLPVYATHDFGMSPQDYSDLSESYPLYEDAIAEILEASNFERVELKLKKGQALIWDANLLHGGSPIRDANRTRLTQVTHYVFEGCAYYGALQSDIPLGKMVWRQVHNIIDGSYVVHRYNGRAAVAPQFDGSPRMLTLAD